jgi:DNA-binding CsgD family transcriptional regulator
MICLRNHTPALTTAELRISHALLLDYISLPIFVLNRELSLIYANAAGFEQIDISDFVQLSSGRIHILANSHQVAKFETAVHSATDREADQVDRSTTMLLGDARSSKMSVTITPFNDADPSHHMAVVIFTAVEVAESDMTQRLQQTLNLTPAEARVAYFISAGYRPKSIASQLNVSINTVKSQLANIFSKTGCTDQAAFCVLAKQLCTPVRMS